MIDNIVINIRWRSTSFRNPDGLLPWSTQPRRKLTKQYLPLVQDGTRAYLEVGDSDLFPGILPPDVVASVFTNLETYLVLANYGTSETAIDTARGYVPAAAPFAPARKEWILKGRSFVILRQSM